MTESAAEGEPYADRSDGWAVLLLAALGAGVVIGFIGGAFRWCLTMASTLRVELVDWAHRLPGPGWLIPMAAAALGATLAALVVRWMPLAAGSGIQHVEAVFRRAVPPPPLSLVPAKFIGGVLAIGSGLVLGREGPTVHIGAAIGAEAARQARLDEADARMMQTALGGAGLAVAFNAPIGGVLFTLEEATKSLRLRTVVTTLLAAAIAVGCARLILGNHPDFQVLPIDDPTVGLLPVVIVFGALTGALGALYNRTVLGFLDTVAAWRVPRLVTAATIGAVIGLAMFIDPNMVGDGDDISQLILGGHSFVLPALIGLLVVRFIAGPLSYSAAVPGGLFAPLLAIGAMWGVLFAGAVAVVSPFDAQSLVIPLAVVGMGAFFGAVVRAPVTGIVIVIEMTAATWAAVPLLAATAAAVLVAELLGSQPIYDSLRDRMPEQGGRPAGSG